VRTARIRGKRAGSSSKQKRPTGRGQPGSRALQRHKPLGHNNKQLQRQELGLTSPLDAAAK
jgi:hypothetical protein